MSEKLSDEDVREIRDRYDRGETKADLAEEFRVSVRHVSRIVSGSSRPFVAPDDCSQLDAVNRFLDTLELDPAGETLAETARVLAVKLDAVRASDAATAASAAPNLARQMVDTVEALRRTAKREPSPLDLIRARREQRLQEAQLSAARKLNPDLFEADAHGNRLGEHSDLDTTRTRS